MPRDRSNASDPPPNDPPLIRSNAWNEPFPLTSWTLIRGAIEGSEWHLTEFYRRYATPVYCYFLAKDKKRDRELAKDLTQDLFVKLANGKLLKNAEPRGTRFRTYLKTAATNAWIDYTRRGQVGSGQEGSVRRPKSLDKILDEAGPYVEPATNTTPEEIFDCHWARSILEIALQRAEAECEASGFSINFKIVEARFLGQSILSWQEAGQQNGIPDGNTARNRAATAQERIGKALVEELRLDGLSESEVKQEVWYFIELLKKQIPDDAD